MTQKQDDREAWTLDPGDYLASRDCTHDLPAPQSHYLEMPDGIRLAIDLYVPSGERPADGFPTILHLTPYYRRFALKPGAPAETEACPNAAKFRDVFVPHGYAMVVVDVRGTGASFGSRDSFRSPAERDDYRTIIDWIAAQDWSNGRVGATGISYVGAAADFAATTGHPALKAIAPISAVWDTYLDHYYPGGLLLTKLAGAYDRLMQALDLDRREQVRSYAYFSDPSFAGPAPVDGDEDGELLRQAVSGHAANVSITDFIREFPFRDSALAYDPSFTPDSFSPCAYSPGNSPDLAVLSISGWMDGGYMNGSIARFLTLGGNKRHLLLGPWDHGARTDISPFRKSVEPTFPLMGTLLRFFDEYVRQQDTGLSKEAPVHYFTLAAERWKQARSWPPTGTGVRQLHLTDEKMLSDQAATKSAITHTVDYSFGSGNNTRYGRLAALDVKGYYTSWDARSGRLLRFLSDPLDEDVTVSGHPIISLLMESDQHDAAVFAYLEDIAPDGKRRYVTEGMLRALHRRESSPPESYKASWPYHSCTSEDAVPLTPGVADRIRFAMLATSWEFRKGHRIGLALAGADRDNFALIPYGRPGTWTLHFGDDEGSLIELPVEGG